MTRYWIRLAVSIGVIFALLWWTDAAKVSEHLMSLHLGWIGISLLAVTGATLSMALRWQLTARALQIQFDYSFALREYYIAQLTNSVLPGGVTGDVARAFRTRHQADLRLAAQSVLAERLLGQVAIICVLFIGFSAALMFPLGIKVTVLSWTVVLTLGCGLIAVVALSRFNTAVGRFVSFLLKQQSQTEFLLLGVVSSFCLIFGFYTSARAVGAEIPIESLVTVIPLILCAMIIPLSIGGWGWREGAAAALFPIIGLTSSEGLASSITYGAVVLVATLPAVFVVLWPRITGSHLSKGKASSP
ncbi:lysylphosphatidylglycerol synthase transmembrane domain-containing protein [Ruegeria profundi]|uniref:lysylphosphatidylglycerol synthase transmembrane domain-containing protein n=1 Tax=Ruegeria profundi TaxID=1685378 RepID=UPI001CD67F92|nr:lysylphosphatidylglycerol synthase transmembrane domain-containing protein [Ruegeria profundi]MCA0928087.1 flippase-like domain-containing protein [Ruegeria profundi]